MTADPFVQDFDAVCRKHGIGFDTALERLADAVKADRSVQEHAAVIDLLESAETCLRQAAFDIYASYK